MSDESHVPARARRRPTPDSRIPNPCLYACLYRPPTGDHPGSPDATVAAIAQDFSPRYETYGADLVVIDASGLGRLFGPPRAIGDALRRALDARDIRAHVAIAGTQTAALVLAQAQPGVTVVAPGAEEQTLAPVAIGMLKTFDVRSLKSEVTDDGLQTSDFILQTLQRWGIRTLGDVAALPAADLVARLGRDALEWQARARGEDRRPLIPTLDEERFESTLELEWPIDGLEPLSFVLTRLLEPLSTRLERRDRGAAVLHVVLRLVTRESFARRLELPTPMRDVRTLRTLALLDLESHPPAAAIDRVTIVIDPTPGRVLQHTLFARAHPTPELVSTLLARLGAVMGQDRIGAAATVDSYRPGAFEMKAFKTEHETSGRAGRAGHQPFPPLLPASSLQQALHRCRHPVPARVAIADGRPVRVTTDRRGFAGGAVVQCAGPWRTSGNWWAGGAAGAGRPGDPYLPFVRDEWDVALSDGAVYRIFQDRDTEAWFIDAIAD